MSVNHGDLAITPTTCVQGAVLPSSQTYRQCPTADWPGQKRRASASFTPATGAAVGWLSASAKNRPAASRAPTTCKYAGSTALNIGAPSPFRGPDSGQTLDA